MARMSLRIFWLPTLAAGVATAVTASLVGFFLTMSYYAYQPLELIKSLLALVVVGLVLGLVAVWPIMLFMGFIGSRLAATRALARASGAWIVIGGITGCAIFGAAIVFGGEAMDVFPILLFGYASGALGGFLCHLLLRIGRDR